LRSEEAEEPAGELSEYG